MTTSRLTVDETEPGRLRCAGVIDAHTAPSLESAVRSTELEGDLMIDLHQVEFVDSSGLRVFVGAHHRCSEAGGRLVLVRPSEAVLSLVEIAGLKDHLHIAS